MDQSLVKDDFYVSQKLLLTFWCSIGLSRCCQSLDYLDVPVTLKGNSMIMFGWNPDFEPPDDLSKEDELREQEREDLLNSFEDTEENEIFTDEPDDPYWDRLLDDCFGDDDKE